jgi:hypothetical protein
MDPVLRRVDDVLEDEEPVRFVALAPGEQAGRLALPASSTPSACTERAIEGR